MQREGRGEAGQQRAGLLARLPPGQGEWFEAVLQLVIGADRQVGLLGAGPDQRDAQLVAQEAQQVEELPPGVGLSGQDVVQLVDDQDPHPDRPQEAQGGLFHFGHPLPGA